MKALVAGGLAIGAMVIAQSLSTNCSSAKQSDGRFAGPSNKAACADMRKRMASSGVGVSFAVPASDSMMCAFDAMKAEIGSRRLDTAELEAACNLWLNAYDAGFAASKSNAITDSLYEESSVNYSTVKLPLPASGRPTSHEDFPCDASDSVLTDVGKTVCALVTIRDQLRAGGAWGTVEDASQSDVIARIKAAAAAMDAADFVAEGKRPHDKLDIPLGEFLGGLVGDLFKGVFAISPATLVVLGVGGVVAWRYLR